MTFFIRTADDFAHEKIMETIASRGLTHTKSNVVGTSEFEILGGAEDFRYFQDRINELNATRGATVALITEGM